MHPAASIAQLGERKTEDLEAPCSIHGRSIIIFTCIVMLQTFCKQEVVPALFFQFSIGPQTRINPRITGIGISQVRMPSLLAEQARQNTPPCSLLKIALPCFRDFSSPYFSPSGLILLICLRYSCPFSMLPGLNLSYGTRLGAQSRSRTGKA